LAKTSRTSPPAPKALGTAPKRLPRPDTVHSSVYLPMAVHEALREAAFKERLKIHDIIMQGIELALKKRGFPPIDDLKAGKGR
jgi:hypothetical protein